MRAPILAILSVSLTGCAALPIPLQPRTDNNSNVAEIAFLATASVDTLQSMHIRAGTSCDHEADPVAAALYGSRNPSPARVLVTNVVMMTAHAMVSSWLDDKVEEARTRDDGSVGPWYIGRIVWHVVSTSAEASAVINNHARGCKL